LRITGFYYEFVGLKVNFHFSRIIGIVYWDE
jgi:hypothetical protein